MRSPRREPLSICLVAHNAYGVLARKDTGHVGGIEVQVPLMARWLARRGHRVSMITWDDGGSDGEVIDGVKAFKLCRRDAGLPGLRFFVPRWSSFNAALTRADARIVYYNCGDVGLGQLILWARPRGRKVVFSVSSNADCVQSLPNLAPLRERVLYRYGLRRATSIVVQTDVQRTLLEREFGLSADVLPMPSAGFDPPTDRSAKATSVSKRVLWAGRFHVEKRLEMLLALAERHPNVAFDVVGDANSSSRYVEGLYERARRIQNVTLHGRVSHELMGDFHRRATVLCCTSTYEGFPNVFLEAWSAGVPVLTTFDPDGLVARHGLGRVASNLAELDRGLEDLLRPEQWLAASEAALGYFRARHALESALPRFEERFLSIASSEHV